MADTGFPKSYCGSEPHCRPNHDEIDKRAALKHDGEGEHVADKTSGCKEANYGRSAAVSMDNLAQRLGLAPDEEDLSFELSDDEFLAEPEPPQVCARENWNELGYIWWFRGRGEGGK